MSIHILLGKPGSGKSLYAVRRLLDELADTERNIVTNLPLRLDRLNEYLQQRHPLRDLRPMQRIRLLSDEELRRFWDIRGNEGEPDKGVAYFLDEAHIAFNARDWANLGKGALFYLSQHRKLGDIVWVITQAPGNLDKQFRSVAEDFTVMRNEYTAKFGPFRGRGRFVRRTYLSEPQANSEAFETSTFSLDGVKECYDTAKGVGVHGSKADIGRRAKGIPIIWVVPAALLLGLACVFVPMLVGKWARKTMDGGAKAVPGQKADTAQPGQKADILAPRVLPAAPVTQAPPVPAAPAAPSEPLRVRGVLTRGGAITLILSDGRTLTEWDTMNVNGRRVQTIRSVDRGGAWLADGTRVPMAQVRSGIEKKDTPSVERVEPVVAGVDEFAAAEKGRMDRIGEATKWATPQNRGEAAARPQPVAVSGARR